MEWNLVMLDFQIAAPFKPTPWEGILTTAENATSPTANMSPRTGVAGTVLSAHPSMLDFPTMCSLPFHAHFYCITQILT